MLASRKSLVCLFICLIFLLSDFVSADTTILVQHDLREIAIDNDRDLAYVSDYEAGKILVVSMISESIVNELNVGTNPVGLSISPAGNKLYVALSGDTGIGIVNLGTMTKTGTIPLTQPPYDVQFGTADRAYVTTTEGWGLLVMLNAATDTVMTTFPQKPLDLLFSSAIMGYDSARNYLYVGERGLSPASLYMMDANTDPPTFIQEDDHGELGSNLKDLRIDSVYGNIYLACGAPYHIQVRQYSNLDEIGTLDTGAYPSAVCLVPDGGTAFAAWDSYYEADDVKQYNTLTYVEQDSFGFGEYIDVVERGLDFWPSGSNAGKIIALVEDPDESSVQNIHIKSLNYTPQPTPIASYTPLPTFTPEATDTPTTTPSGTWYTRTPSPTPTLTPTKTPTLTPTDTPTSPPTLTPTQTFTASNTPTLTNTSTRTNTPVHTPTPPPTNTPYVHSYELCRGLNFLSISRQDASVASASSLLQSFCVNGADALWIYDCNTKKFASWTLIDMGTGWATYPGMPFWINITDSEGCDWSLSGPPPAGLTYSLCIGLNMISLPDYSHSIVGADNLLASVPNCAGVFRWIRSMSCLSPQGFLGYFALSTPAENFAVPQGYAYWVTVTRSGTWIPPNP